MEVHDDEKLKQSVHRWRRSPLAWSKLFTPAIKWRKNQREALEKLGGLICAILKQHNKEPMTDEEIKLARKKGISIMSGQNAGKDFLLAFCFLWFMFCFPNHVKCAAMASTEKQLKNVLWSEIQKIISMSARLDGDDSPPILDQVFELASDKMSFKGKSNKENFLEALVSSNRSDAPATVAGRHEKYMLIGLDEASDVADSACETMEGTIGGEDSIVNLIFFIFNPNRNAGFAIDTQYKDSPSWITLHWDCEELAETEKEIERVESLKIKYGENSNFYRIRVKGLPPISDKDSLIPFEWVERAFGRWSEVDPKTPFTWSLDMGAGKDPSVLTLYQGPNPHKLVRIFEKDADIVEGKIIYELNNGPDWAGMVMDNIGIGHGTFYHLAAMKGIGYRLFGCDVRMSGGSRDYCALRDRIWWEDGREGFEKDRINLLRDDETKSQFTTITYKTPNGKIKVESKEDLKARHVQSPNDADSIIMNFWLQRNIGTIATATQNSFRPYRGRDSAAMQGLGWLAA